MQATTTRRRFLTTAALGASVFGSSVFLAACGQVAATPSEQAPSEAPQAEDAPASSEEAQAVVFWHRGSYPYEQYGDEFAETNPGYTIAPDAVSGRLDKYVAAAAAGTPPDICDVTPFGVQELGVTEVSQPLTSYFKASATLNPEDIWASLMNDMTHKPNGHIYGSPLAPDLRVIFIHANAYLEAGLDPENPPQTWDNLEDATIRTTKVEGQDLTRAGFPAFWGSGGTNLWLMPFWQLGGEVVSDDGRTATLDNELGLQTLSWLKNVHDLQGGWDAIATLRGEGVASTQHFADGRVTHLFATFTNRNGWFQTNAPDLQYGYSPWPLPEGGRDVNYGGCHTLTMATLANNPEGAWAWIEFMAADDVNLRFSNQYDRVPISPAVAGSDGYLQGDAFRELIVAQMPHRKFNYPGLGGSEIRRVQSAFIPDAMAGTITLPEALTQANTNVQQVLDAWV